MSTINDYPVNVNISHNMDSVWILQRSNRIGVYEAARRVTVGINGPGDSGNIAATNSRAEPP
jgi:hypothetical protein